MKKDTSVNVRLEGDDRSDLQLLADHHKRESLSAYIRLVLRQHTEDNADLIAELRRKAKYSQR